MNYHEALNYIHSLSKFGSKPGLDRVSRLVSLANNPHKDLKFIHIAGTSGKGSTANICASILKSAGYKVGLYTSPFIIDFRERFQISGENIPKDEFCALVERLIPLVEKLNSQGDIITEFEFNTALGFLWFKEQNCDIVCLEVGMGGRFDATNLIENPCVSVITSIGLDHTEYLGDTIEKVAFEKCGIIKEGCRVVSYPLQKEGALKVIKQTCEERNCALSIPSLDLLNILSQSIDTNEFEYSGLRFRLNMSGEHQIYNALTAITAVKNCGLIVSDEAIVKGVAAVRCAARLEVISQNPTIIIDGAHNADKVRALYEFIKPYKGRIVSVCGMLGDKDYLSATEMIAPLCKSIITVTPDNPRALSAQKMAEETRKYCLDCTAADSVRDGAILAFNRLEGDDILLCWGSLYIAGEVRETILTLI